MPLSPVRSTGPTVGRAQAILQSKMEPPPDQYAPSLLSPSSSRSLSTASEISNKEMPKATQNIKLLQEKLQDQLASPSGYCEEKTGPVVVWQSTALLRCRQEQQLSVSSPRASKIPSSTSNSSFYTASSTPRFSKNITPGAAGDIETESKKAAPEAVSNENSSNRNQAPPNNTDAPSNVVAITTQSNNCNEMAQSSKSELQNFLEDRLQFFENVFKKQKEDDQCNQNTKSKESELPCITTKEPTQQPFLCGLTDIFSPSPTAKNALSQSQDLKSDQERNNMCHQKQNKEEEEDVELLLPSNRSCSKDGSNDDCAGKDRPEFLLRMEKPQSDQQHCPDITVSQLKQAQRKLKEIEAKAEETEQRYQKEKFEWLEKFLEAEQKYQKEKFEWLEKLQSAAMHAEELKENHDLDRDEWTRQLKASKDEGLALAAKENAMTSELNEAHSLLSQGQRQWDEERNQMQAERNDLHKEAESLQRKLELEQASNNEYRTKHEFLESSLSACKAKLTQNKTELASANEKLTRCQKEMKDITRQLSLERSNSERSEKVFLALNSLHDSYGKTIRKIEVKLAKASEGLSQHRDGLVESPMKDTLAKLQTSVLNDQGATSEEIFPLQLHGKSFEEALKDAEHKIESALQARSVDVDESYSDDDDLYGLRRTGSVSVYSESVENAMELAQGLEDLVQRQNNTHEKESNAMEMLENLSNLMDKHGGSKTQFCEEKVAATQSKKNETLSQTITPSLSTMSTSSSHAFAAVDNKHDQEVIAMTPCGENLTVQNKNIKEPTQTRPNATLSIAMRKVSSMSMVTEESVETSLHHDENEPLLVDIMKAPERLTRSKLTPPPSRSKTIEQILLDEIEAGSENEPLLVDVMKSPERRTKSKLTPPPSRIKPCPSGGSSTEIASIEHGLPREQL